jgi:hypothetical protein
LHRESAEAKAQEIIAEGLKRLGWRKNELSRRRKGDPSKLVIAARLRRETTLDAFDQANRRARAIGHLQKRQCSIAQMDENRGPGKLRRARK